MSEPVKKPYTSALRTAQARATRRAIVDAAARLFIDRGYGATTVDAIAQAAHGDPDARRILTSYARDLREIVERIAPLNAVVQAAAGLDAEIRALAGQGRAQRMAGMRVLAQTLADRGALKPGLTPAEASDILWLFSDPGVYHRLVVEQRWTPDRYQDWLTEALISLLIADDYQPGADSP